MAVPDPPEPYPLARYLYFIGRSDLNKRQTLTATLLAQLFFHNGWYTGFPAGISATWLAERGVGGIKQIFEPHRLRSRPPSAAHVTVMNLMHYHILTLLRRPGRGLPSVYALQTDESRWLWPYGLYDIALMEWEEIAEPYGGYNGAGHIVRTMAPMLDLFSDRLGTIDPQNERLRDWWRFGKQVAEIYGLNGLAEVVDGVLLNPDDLYPVDVVGLERNLLGFMYRGRRERYKVDANAGDQLPAEDLDDPQGDDAFPLAEEEVSP